MSKTFRIKSQNSEFEFRSLKKNQAESERSQNSAGSQKDFEKRFHTVSEMWLQSSSVHMNIFIHLLVCLQDFTNNDIKK